MKIKIAENEEADDEEKKKEKKNEEKSCNINMQNAFRICQILKSDGRKSRKRVYRMECKKKSEKKELKKKLLLQTKKKWREQRRWTEKKIGWIKNKKKKRKKMENRVVYIRLLYMNVDYNTYANSERWIFYTLVQWIWRVTGIGLSTVLLAVHLV